uniref:Uncharacterized protein n=1 Tax=Medicago truncatula TaxID=3880 RepID=I3T9J8_MEDTR|nr:unknown [Medicago truncatula]
MYLQLVHENSQRSLLLKFLGQCSVIRLGDKHLQTCHLR